MFGRRFFILIEVDEFPGGDWGREGEDCWNADLWWL